MVKSPSARAVIPPPESRGINAASSAKAIASGRVFMAFFMKKTAFPKNSEW